MATYPTPSRKHYSALGVRHGETVEACIAAFERWAEVYDPRRWPNDLATQHRIIGHQDDIDEALSVIVDAERLGEVAA